MKKPVKRKSLFLLNDKEAEILRKVRIEGEDSLIICYNGPDEHKAALEGVKAALNYSDFARPNDLVKVWVSHIPDDDVKKRTQYTRIRDSIYEAFFGNEFDDNEMWN